MVTQEQIERAREVEVHWILGIPNTGRRIAMSCPFPDHNDGTPSFMVYPDGSYRCFGCDKWGSHALDFIVHMGYKFDEAVEQLTTNG